jgi:hypothetical protein
MVGVTKYPIRRWPLDIGSPYEALSGILLECDFTRIECVDDVLITRQKIFKYNGR